MILVLQSNTAMERSEIENRLAEIIAPLGFSVQVIWADKGTPGADLSEGITSAYQSPWTWMLIGGLITLKFMAGWNGLFWTLFWGTSSWFASKVVISKLKQRKIGTPPPLARR